MGRVHGCCWIPYYTQNSPSLKVIWFQISRELGLGKPALDETISWFILCNKSKEHPTQHVVTRENPFWRARHILPKRFFFSHWRWNFNNPSCYCWHLMEQETKWKTEGTVQAAPNEQPLPCCSLMEYLIWTTGMYFATESKQCLHCKTGMTCHTKKNTS